MSTKTFEYRSKEFQKKKLAELFNLPVSRIQERIDQKDNKIFIAEISATNLVFLNIVGDSVYAKNVKPLKRESKDGVREVFLFSQKYKEIGKRPIARRKKNQFESFLYMYDTEEDRIVVEMERCIKDKETYCISGKLEGYSQTLLLDFLKEIEKSFFKNKDAKQEIQKVYDFFRKTKKISYIRCKSS